METFFVVNLSVSKIYSVIRIPSQKQETEILEIKKIGHYFQMSMSLI
jgi:hypothetical protein